MKKTVLSLSCLIGSLFTNAQTGSTLNFDGVNDYVNIGNTITTTTGYTKEAWIYVTNTSNNNIISSSKSPFWIPGGHLSAMHNFGGPITLQDPAVIPLNTWVHVAVTYDAATTTMRLYKNGLQVAVNTAAAAYIVEPIQIGAFTSAALFRGNMDEARIWNVARTQCEINTYKDCEIPSTSVGLIANYHFNQGVDAGNNLSVNTLTDASGFSNTGSLNNFALSGTTSNWISPGAVVSGYTTTAIMPTISVTSGAICSGESFTMIPSGASTYTYSNGTDIVSPTINTTYSVSGTSTTGCLSSNTAVSSVTVNALPIISVNSGTICSGNSFTVIPSGASTYTYSSGSAIVSPTMNTSYSVTGTSADGCLSSNTAISNVMLFISDQVVTITPATICAGSSTTVDVQSSEIGVSYTLRDNTTNAIIAGPIAGTGSSIAFNTGAISSTTSYNVNANKLGSSTALDFKAAGRVTITGLDISPSVIPVFTAEAWIKLTTSNGLQTVIGNDNGGYDRGMIVWNGEYHIFAGTDINTGIIPNINVWEHVAISWSASNIEMYVNGVNVFSTTGETIDPGPTDTYISGVYPVDGKIDEVRLWNTARTLSQISSNMNTCLIGNEAGLIAYYKFEDGIGSSILSDLTINGHNGTLSNINVNTDWVTGTNVCGAGNCTIQMVNTPTITVNPLPTITVNSGAICPGQSFTMVPNGASTYTYSNGSAVVYPTTNTSYNVYGTDANGCDNFSVSTVTVNALPIVMATTNNTLLCSGQTASLTASGAMSYTWNTSATTSVIAVSPTTTVTFTVNGTDANGCSNVTTVTQNVSTCTDIQSTVSNQQLSISVYPNPTEGIVNIELKSLNDKNVSIQILNTLGEVLMNESVNTKYSAFNIQHFATGVYFIKVIENNKQQVIKLIKD